MIHVNRPAELEPPILTKQYASDDKTETERAIDHYTKSWDGKTGYDFGRYRDDDVKDALEKLYHGKCAYCESNFRHVSPEDIEHWRPKGAVQLEDGTQVKPGYYWLAATWSNLLPSCIDCNRRRRQEDVLDVSNLQSGKANLFPVADENDRWRQHDEESHEVPLLLDPCVDQPDEFIRLDLFDDNRPVVIEEPPAETLENDRARHTIDTFGLNRSALVDKRKEHYLQVVGLVADVRLLLRNILAQPPGPLQEENRSAVRRKLGEIAKQRGPASEYLLMKRPLLDDFAAGIGPLLVEASIVDP